MYEEVFNLRSRPFTSTPYVNHFYPAQAISAALDLCRQTVERGMGPVLIVGDHGTGKTLTLAMLEQQYASQYKVVKLSCAMLQSRADLLQSVLFEAQQDYRGMNEGEMRLGLIDYVKSSDRSGAGVLLLLDDAQKLSRDTIEELQLLTNYIQDGQPRVRTVLAGSRNVEDRLADPGLESFNQRIAGRSFLECLDRAEVRSYVEAHIENAGGSPTAVFEEQAFRAISDVSEGRPRVINQVCDHAMIFAATRGICPINDSLIREAWMDAQKLPCGIGTVTQETTRQTSSPVISVDESDGWTVLEFGELDSEAQDGQASSDFQSTAKVKDTTAATQQPVKLGSNDNPALESVRSETGESTLDAYSETTTAPESVTQSGFSQSPHEFQPEVQTESQSGQSHEGSADLCHDEIESQTASPEPAVNENREAKTPCEQVQPQAIDPFAGDQFDEEEVLTDAYAPFVAQQNEKSLDVTTDHLRDLAPEDLDQSTSATAATSPAEPQTTAATPTVLATDPTEAEELFPTFESAMESPAPVRTPVQRQYEQREELETRYESEGLGPDSNSDEFYVQNDLLDATEIELQAINGADEGSDALSLPPNIVPLDPDTPPLAMATDSNEVRQHSGQSSAEQSASLLRDEHVEQTEPQSAEKEKFHVQAEAPNDPDISRMAADIIRSLAPDAGSGTGSVSHETTRSEIEQETVAIESTIRRTLEQQGRADFSNDDSPAVILSNVAGQGAEENSTNSRTPTDDSMTQSSTISGAFPTQNQSTQDRSAELDQPAIQLSPRSEMTSQESEILGEIRRQSSMIEQASDTLNQAEETRDDRDILNVSQNIDDMPQQVLASNPEQEMPAWSQREPSQGEANRVDYQQLFNQLRNINPTDQSRNNQ